MNRSAGQTNHSNREVIWVIYLFCAMIHSPWTQKKDIHSLYLQCFQQRLVLKFSEKGYKFKIPIVTGTLLHLMYGMVYQQIMGIPIGTNCAQLIANKFLYCYERDFMSNLQKSKRFDLIDKFNDTSRYLDDIFTIDNPVFDFRQRNIFLGFKYQSFW